MKNISRLRVSAFAVLVLFASVVLASVFLEWDFSEDHFAQHPETRLVNPTDSGWAERSSAYGAAFGMHNSLNPSLADQANRGTVIRVTFSDGSSIGLVVLNKLNPWSTIAEIPGTAVDKNGNPITPKERLTGDMSAAEAADWLKKFVDFVTGSDEGGFFNNLIGFYFGDTGGGNPYQDCFVVTPPLTQTVTYGPNGEVSVTGHVPVSTLECPMS